MKRLVIVFLFAFSLGYSQESIENSNSYSKYKHALELFSDGEYLASQKILEDLKYGVAGFELFYHCDSGKGGQKNFWKYQEGGFVLSFRQFFWGYTGGRGVVNGFADSVFSRTDIMD